MLAGVRGGLGAKAVGATYNSSLAVERTVQYIHSDDMLGLVVPRAVLAPVVC